MDMLTVNGKVWQVRRLLGKGKGGYSYLAADDQGREAVVKQIHHEPCSYYQFGDKLAAELRDYDTLSRLGIPMPRLLEVDQGAERLVKEYLPGRTVYQLLLEEGAIPPDYLEQMKALCAVLYPAGLNIDYFPTNFIPRDGKLYYVDYECNGYMEQWDFDHWGISYWSRSSALLEHARAHGDL